MQNLVLFLALGVESTSTEEPATTTEEPTTTTVAPSVNLKQSVESPLETFGYAVSVTPDGNHLFIGQSFCGRVMPQLAHM
jgi:hypothetical protein